MRKHTSDPLFWLLILAAAMIVGVFVQRAFAQQPEDPFRNTPPHDVPHCTPTGQGQAAARCGCTGMVHEVHQAIVLHCWGKTGIKGKPDPWLLDHPPKEVLDCMEANHKDHCEIVADAWHHQQKWGVKFDHKKQCRTACRPDRCGCADSGCRAHSAPGATY